MECDSLVVHRSAIYGEKIILRSVSGWWEVVLSRDDVIGRNPRWRLKTGSSDFSVFNDVKRLKPKWVWYRKNFRFFYRMVFEMGAFLNLEARASRPINPIA